MASTPTRSPRRRYAVTSALVTVDFPAPGEPVRPITRAWPASGASSFITERSRGEPSSISETSRARARGSPSCARTTSSGASLPEMVTRLTLRGLGRNAEDQRLTLAAATAQPGGPQAAAAAGQLVHQVQGDP